MDILTWAQNQVNNHASHYQSSCGLGSGDAWCAAFITTGLKECGEYGVIENNNLVCASEWKGGAFSYQGYFKNKGQYFDAGSGYRPQPGDIVCWGKGSAATSNMGSHVGIVESVDPDGTVHTIEGNRRKDGTKQVIRDSYTPGTAAYANISGFAQPHYQQAPVGGGNYTGTYQGMDGYGSASESYTAGVSLGVGLYDFIDYTVQDGDTLESIAEQFGVSVDLLCSYNELNSWDTLTAGDILKIPQKDTLLSNPWEAGTQNIKRAHTKTVKVYHPVIKAEFYAEGGALAVSSEMTGDERVYGDKDLDFDIISCSTQRSLSSDCSSMSITLTNRRDWYNILSSNDLVIVKMRRPEFGTDAALDEAEQEVFIGVIDDIRKSLDFSSGKPRRSIQVTARGLEKAFVNFNIGWIKNITVNLGVGFMGNAVLSSDAEAGGSSGPAIGERLQGNSAQVISAVWDSYVGKTLRYEFYNGKCLEDYIVYEGTDHPYEKMTDFGAYNSYSGSLWNFIKELTNSPFNESFWEIRQTDGGPKNVLVHRPTPFNPEEWKKLRRTIIRDDDIVTDATGRSDMETYTVFIVHQKQLTMAITRYTNPLWYLPYYYKYGIAQLEVTTTYLTAANEGGQMSTEGLKQYAQDIFNWNIKNNKFANGQIVVKGRASYKIGEIVVLEYNGLEFYVEGVSHSFNVYGGWSTTLSVTRGILPEERFTSPWGAAQEMPVDAMNKIVSLSNGEYVDWSTLELTNPEGFTVNGGGSSGLLGGTGGTVAGSEIIIPSTLQQSGCVPDDVTNYASQNWNAGTNQRRLYDIWRANGSSTGGIATLDGRVLVAMADGVIGTAGDVVDIYLDNGAVIPAIIADEKGTDRGFDYGHWQSYSAAGGIHAEGVSLVEWERTGNHEELTQTLKDNNWYLAKVTKVVNGGSYFSS